MYSLFYRYAPSKRWHIDTIMRVLTTVRILNNILPLMPFDLDSQHSKQWKYYPTKHKCSNQIWGHTLANTCFHFIANLEIFIEDSFLIGLVSVLPHRQGAMCETIPFQTSSSSSPTVWRCMPTQSRDSTKHCWMTSHRSEQFSLDLGHLH